MNGLTKLSNAVRLKLSNSIRQFLLWENKEVVMEQYKLGEMESRFAELIWENAPIAAGELAKLCE